jgi:hypothetical protein
VLRAVRNDARPAQRGGKSALELLQVRNAPFPAGAARADPERANWHSIAAQIAIVAARGCLTRRPLPVLFREKAQEVVKHVITFCSDMDTMLGGGVAVGEVTEFCGAPGECVTPRASVAFACTWLEQEKFRGPLWARALRRPVGVAAQASGRPSLASNWQSTSTSPLFSAACRLRCPAVRRPMHPAPGSQP